MTKAIETYWNGIMYRSRVEARWAVYFDLIKMDHYYEHEGYALCGGEWYLPDFWLPQVEMFAEVKGGDFNESEIEKCVRLLKATGHNCILLNGPPRPVNYWTAREIIMQEECGGGCEDVIITDMYLSEHRFYSATGSGYPVQEDYSSQYDISKINAANSERFEYVAGRPVYRSQRERDMAIGFSFTCDICEQTKSQVERAGGDKIPADENYSICESCFAGES